MQSATTSEAVPRLAQVTDYVAAAGLRWLVRFEPRRVRAAFDKFAPEFFPAARVAAFEASTGVPIGELSGVAIAGYDYSTLYIARTEGNFLRAAGRFERRLNPEPSRQQVLDRVVVVGLHQGEPESYVSLDPTTSAWSEGDPTSAKAAVLLARRRLVRSHKALDGASLSLLPTRCRTGSMAAFVPGPLNNALADAEAHLSTPLSRVLALSAQVRFVGQRLLLTACLVGDWDDGKGSVQGLVQGLLNTGFARLLELDVQERAPEYTTDGGVVEVAFDWNAQRVLGRLHSLVNLELGTLFSEQPP